VGAYTSITRPAELQVTLGYCGSPAKASQLGELWQEMLRGANTETLTKTVPAVGMHFARQIIHACGARWQGGTQLASRAFH
jgi:hypothetical protein